MMFRSILHDNVFLCFVLSNNCQQSTRGGSKASAAFHIAPGGAAGGISSSSQQQQRLPFSSLQPQAGAAGSSGAAAAAAGRSADGSAGSTSNGAGSSKAPNYESLDFELVENTGVQISAVEAAHAFAAMCAAICAAMCAVKKPGVRCCHGGHKRSSMAICDVIARSGECTLNSTASMCQRLSTIQQTFSHKMSRMWQRQLRQRLSTCMCLWCAVPCTMCSPVV
jgi:hypothetical protein